MAAVRHRGDPSSFVQGWKNWLAVMLKYGIIASFRQDVSRVKVTYGRSTAEPGGPNSERKTRTGASLTVPRAFRVAPTHMYICRASSCQMELWVAQRRATSTICFCYAPMFARLLSVPHRKKDGCSRKVQSAKHAKEAKSSVTLRRRREARGRYGATWRSIGTKMKS
jgi:hypothetical protein